MARGVEQQASASKTELYLVVPSSVGASGDFAALEAAMEAAQIAAVLVQADNGANDQAVMTRAIEIGKRVQPRGAAMLLQDRPGLVKATGADGAHLTGVESVQASVSGLKPDLIAGVGGVTSRHEAMLAAEFGADYILFGGPGADGRVLPFVTVLERVAWWSELFQIPCVGWAESVTEAAQIASAGAEFVAVSQFIWDDSRGPAAALVDVVTRLDDTEVVR